MKKRYVLLIALLLMLTSVSADEDIMFRDSVFLDFEITSRIDVETNSSYSLEYVKTFLNYNPKDSFRQKIKYFETTPKAEIDDMIIFEWKRPRNFPLNLILKTKIETSADFFKIKKKVDFPIKEYPIDIYKYTKHSQMIDINDEIREIAASIAEGEDDLYIVAFKLAEWTRENIEYDLSSVAAEAVKSSTWVLENKKGVCDELTNLFISFLRSLGIPARFVTGFSYTNSPDFPEPWGPHGWAEVYFPDYGWVPFDPTYGQLGFIDAGHIKLKDSVDSNRSSTEYEWLGKNVDIIPNPLDMNVNVLNKGPKITPVIDIGLQVFDDKVDFGSYNYIEATVKNTENYYVTSTLYLSTPPKITFLDPQQQSVVLRPYEKKSVFWRIKTPNDLDKGYVYTFPAALTTQRNQTVETKYVSEYKSTDISLSLIDKMIQEKQKDTTDALSFYCTTETIEVNAGNSLVFSCRLKNNQEESVSDLSVCLESDCKKTGLKADEEKSLFFEKEFDEPGSTVISITANNYEISKSFYSTIIVLDVPVIVISGIVYPSNVMYSDEFTVNFSIERMSYAIAHGATLTLYQNKNSENWDIDKIDGKTPFSINLKGNNFKEGRNEIKIIVDYSDNSDNTYSEEKSVVIFMKTEKFTEKIRVYLTQFVFWIERMIFE